MKSDEFYMSRALELADLAEAKGEVPVGALVVNMETGDIVAKAHNEPITLNDPSAHAEILALRKAGEILKNYRLLDHALYVTLEPCTMCVGAIANARIKQIVYAAEDVKGGAVVNGVRFFDQPTCHWHPEIKQGPFAEESAEKLRAFFRSRR